MNRLRTNCSQRVEYHNASPSASFSSLEAGANQTGPKLQILHGTQACPRCMLACFSRGLRSFGSRRRGSLTQLQTLIIQPKKRKCNPALPPKASRLGSTNSAMAKRRTDTTGAADNCRAGPNGNTELIESCSSDNSLHHCRIVTIEGRKSEKIRTLEL